LKTSIENEYSINYDDHTRSARDARPTFKPCGMHWPEVEHLPYWAGIDLLTGATA